MGGNVLEITSSHVERDETSVTDVKLLLDKSVRIAYRQTEPCDVEETKQE